MKDVFPARLRSIRKMRGLSLRENVFAQQGNNKICMVLQISEFYLLFSLSDEDVLEHNRILYRTLYQPLEELLRDL